MMTTIKLFWIRKYLNFISLVWKINLSKILQNNVHTNIESTARSYPSLKNVCVYFCWQLALCKIYNTYVDIIMLLCLPPLKSVNKTSISSKRAKSNNFELITMVSCRSTFILYYTSSPRNIHTDRVLPNEILKFS